jgi:hypothetical protein
MREVKARPISEYHEDMGPVLWWTFPLSEPPYCGMPNDAGHTVEIAVRAFGVDKMMRVLVGGWPGYHTHWTPIELPTLRDASLDDICAVCGASRREHLIEGMSLCGGFISQDLVGSLKTTHEAS